MDISAFSSLDLNGDQKEALKERVEEVTSEMEQLSLSKAVEDKVNCGGGSVGAFGIFPGEVGFKEQSILIEFPAKRITRNYSFNFFLFYQLIVVSVYFFFFK